MRPVPISLVHAFTTELTVQANPSLDGARAPNLELSDLRCEHLTLHPAEKQPHWRVQLKIQQDANAKNNAPYSFRLAMEGWFALAPDFPAEHSERFVAVNGTAILYGLAREQLRQTMSMGPFIPILLPTVTFAPESAQPAQLVARVTPVR
jgi:preprotein translocase subunit SecB